MLVNLKKMKDFEPNIILSQIRTSDSLRQLFIELFTLLYQRVLVKHSITLIFEEPFVVRIIDDDERGICTNNPSFHLQ